MTPHILYSRIEYVLGMGSDFEIFKYSLTVKKFE